MGRCNRQFSCKFLHLFKYCHDFQNQRGCTRLSCHHLHVNLRDMRLYNDTGRMAMTIRSEVERTHQNDPSVCRDNLRGKCEKRKSCSYKHVDITETSQLICKVCFGHIFAGNISWLESCRHVFCTACVHQLDRDSLWQVVCPVCRATGRSSELS